MSTLVTYASIMAACTAVGWSVAWLMDRRKGRSDPIRKHPRGMEESEPYRLSGTVLTAPEMSLHRGLLRAVPEGGIVLAKVRLADFLQVNYGAGDRGEAHARIGNKSVDFLICDANYVPRVALCIDDNAADRDRLRTRDFVNRVCAKAGIPLERLPLRIEYSASEISECVARYFDAKS